MEESAKTIFQVDRTPIDWEQVNIYDVESGNGVMYLVEIGFVERGILKSNSLISNNSPFGGM